MTNQILNPNWVLSHLNIDWEFGFGHWGLKCYFNSMDNLLKVLNERQREAVTAPLGPILVLAGAGSGKTRVLTYRIAHLLKQKLFAPENILALTFTNKAAGEMKERIERLLKSFSPPREGEIKEGVIEAASSRTSPYPSSRGGGLSLTMGTFHSVCARLLRNDIEKLGRGYNRNFVIYDAGDSLGLIKQIILELGLGDRFRPQVFSYYIGAAKNRLVHPDSLKLDNSYLEQTLREVYEIYERRLRDHNALDFDDLLRLVCELLAADKPMLKKYRERFKYVLVDEYQDTNHVQYMILKLLAGERQNIFVVGDDAQSIYGFRGANMRNILDFKKDYPKASIIYLEQNYRSTQGILDVAHHVIKQNPLQFEKKLWTEGKGGAKVSIYEARDEVDEAQFVLKRIANKEYGIEDSTPSLSPPYQGGDEEGVIYDSEETPILDHYATRIKSPKFHIPYSTFEIPNDLNETVILYRTHAQSRPFEEALLTASIPYQIVGGIKFYERKEIKDVLSYLRLIANPRDLVSLSRVINYPARGIGAATFKELAAALVKYDNNFGRLHGNLEKLDLKPKTLAGAKDFLGAYLYIEDLGEKADLLEIMDLILAKSGYKEALLAEGEEGETRWENVEELFNVAGKHKRMPWKSALTSFLEEVALMTDLDSMEEEGNKVTLMTLHSAKGLEFKNVFFVGLEEGLLPHSRSMVNPAEIAEEIRLAYVGITRARENLYLSYARQRQTYGELKRCVPSRILKAIPKRLLQRL